MRKLSQVGNAALGKGGHYRLMVHAAAWLILAPSRMRTSIWPATPILNMGYDIWGLEPEETAYRPLETPLAAVGETRTMADWNWIPGTVVEAMRGSHEFPPIAVFRTPVGWGLIDGVNRSYAAWHLGISTLRAYELMQAPAQAPS